MILVRKPEEIFEIDGEVQDGTFHGRWHFSFGNYFDPEFTNFGTLRVFNDDTLSPGAVWPLHPHHDIEVVTYCAAGEFRHADERGKGGILRKGDVQHTTVGTGMWHSEINNRDDIPMRFIQMWFTPSERGLPPSFEQKYIERSERTDVILPIVSPEDEEALLISSDGAVYASFLHKGRSAGLSVKPGRGIYIYVVEGGGVTVNNKPVPEFGAAMATEESELSIKAMGDSEILIVDVALEEEMARSFEN